MAFDRKLKLVIRSQASRSGDTVTWTDTIIVRLDMSFDVTRSTVFNDNAATITLYNASAETRAKLQTPGTNVLLSAGYADEGDVSLIFSGSIIHCTSSRAGADWITVINAVTMRSQDKPFVTTPVVFSFGPDTPMNTVLDALAQSLGMVLSGTSANGPNEPALSGSANGSNITLDTVNLDLTWPLPNGWAYAGEVRGAISYCEKILAAQGLSLFIDIAELVVYRKGEPSDFSAIFLDYSCGLLSVKEVTESKDLTRKALQAVLEDGNQIEADTLVLKALESLPKKLELECILLSKARPNCLVNVGILGSEYAGYYVAEVVQHKGDNFGGDFSTIIEVASS